MQYRHTGLLFILLTLSACSAGHDLIHGTGTPTTTAPPTANKPQPPTLSGTVSDTEGVIAGANVNGGIARNLTIGDRAALKKATQTALEESISGTAVNWRNDETGHYGSVTPQPAFDMDGAHCREFQQHISARGEMATGYGTACRDKRGIWRIAENG
jgi:surface antigen